MYKRQAISTLTSNQNDLIADFYPLETEHDQLMTNFETLSTNHNTLASTVSTLSAKHTEYDSSISEIESDITSLTTRVTTLENTVDDLPGGSTGGSQTVTVYDRSSDDANINKNLPNGLVIGKTLSIDLTAYNAITLFYNLDGTGAQATFRIDQSRETVDFSVYAGNNGFLTHYTTKLTVAKSRRIISTSFVAEIVVNSDGTVTQTLKSQDANFYIYRIDGIK